MESILIITVIIFISLILAQKNSLFLLLVPFALAQREGLFINPEIFRVEGFSYYRDIILFLYLIIFFIHRKKLKNAIDDNIIDKLFKFYSFYLILLILYTLSMGVINFRVLTIFRIFFYITLYYHFFKVIFNSVTYHQFNQFFNFLFFLNIISSVLYIFDSSGFLNIFPHQSYMELGLFGINFSRDFVTIPIFSALFFITSLVFVNNRNLKTLPKIVHIVNILLSLIVMLLTFTRGFLLAYIIIVVIVLLIELKNKKFFNFLLVGLIMILSSYLIILSFNVYVDFLISRFELLSKSNYFEETNVSMRILLYEMSLETIGKSVITFLFGTGYNQMIMDYFTLRYSAWTGDSMWPMNIVFTGIIGVVILFFIIFASSYKSLRKYFSTKNDFYLIIFLWILYIFFTSFNGEGFMDVRGLGFIPIALVQCRKICFQINKGN